MVKFDEAPIDAWVSDYVREHRQLPLPQEAAFAQFEIDKAELVRLVRVIRAAHHLIKTNDESRAALLLEKAMELYSFERRSCVICGSVEVDRAHIRSKGAGGSMDASNLTLLCRKHHSEQHRVGWESFCTKYPKMEKELNSKGWKFERINGHWKLTRTGG